MIQKRFWKPLHLMC